ncbi:MAG: hypothetical protein KatS3mg102_1531 [Planctomycetota bacterium]|nr:MAG: hypothetical protein KatS3mg102_1531 [Planctomycetota bacterium]
MAAQFPADAKQACSPDGAACGQASAPGQPPRVAEIVQALRAAVGEAEQIAAIRALGRCYRVQAAFNPLRRRLHSSSAAVAREAALALGELGIGAAAQDLERVLRAEHHPARCEAARALGVLGRRASVPALGQALVGAREPAVARAAAHALGEVLDPAAAPWLCSALSGRRELAVRLAAIEAYGRLGPPSMRPAELLALLGQPEAPAELRQAALRAAEQLLAVRVLLSPDDAERAVAQLLEAFALLDPLEVRLARAVRRFGAERLARALGPRLVPAAGSEERQRACRLVGVYQSAELLPLLAALVEPERDPAVLAAAARAAGEIGGREAVGLLRALLGRLRAEHGAGGEPLLWRAVLEALGDTAHPEAVSALGQALQARAIPPPLVHVAAASLCRLLAAAPRRAEALLAELYREPPPELLESLAWLTGELRPAGFEDRLLGLLQRPERHWKRSYVAWALGELASPRAAEALAELLEREPRQSELWPWAVTALGTIATLDPAQAHRLEPLAALAASAGEQAVLERVLRALAAARRLLPARLLAQIHDRASGAVRALALELLGLAGGELACERARAALGSPDPELQRCGLRVLLGAADPAAQLQAVTWLAAQPAPQALWPAASSGLHEAMRAALETEPLCWHAALERLHARLPAGSSERRLVGELMREARLLAPLGGPGLDRTRFARALQASYGELWRRLPAELHDDLVLAAATAAAPAQGGVGEPQHAVVLYARALERAFALRFGAAVASALAEPVLRAQLAEWYTRERPRLAPLMRACKQAGLDVRRRQLQELLEQWLSAPPAQARHALSGLRRWTVLLVLAAADWRLGPRRFADWLGVRIEAAALAPLLGRLKELGEWRNRIVHAERLPPRDWQALAARAAGCCQAVLALLYPPAAAGSAPAGGHG